MSGRKSNDGCAGCCAGIIGIIAVIAFATYIIDNYLGWLIAFCVIGILIAVAGAVTGGFRQPTVDPPYVPPIPTNCCKCGNPLTRNIYEWFIDGKTQRVCYYCFQALERNNSRRAMED